MGCFPDKKEVHVGDPDTHTQLEELHPRKLTWISQMMGLAKGDSGFKYGHFWYVKFLGCKHLGKRENYNDQPADLPLNGEMIPTMASTNLGCCIFLSSLKGKPSGSN